MRGWTRPPGPQERMSDGRRIILPGDPVHQAPRPAPAPPLAQPGHLLLPDGTPAHAARAPIQHLAAQVALQACKLPDFGAEAKKMREWRSGLTRALTDGERATLAMVDTVADFQRRCRALLEKEARRQAAERDAKVKEVQTP